jgi:hypothetical protein
VSTQLEQVYGAAAGRQAKILGGGAETDASLNTETKLEGVTLAASTTYFFRVPTAGATTLQVTLKPSSVTGTGPTTTAYATMLDGITQKGTAVSFTTPSGTTQVVNEVTTLAGERYWMIKMVVPGASTCTFSQAEFNTL